MFTFQGLYTRFTKITSDDSAANQAFGKLLINETQKNICGMYDFPFREKTITRTSTASQEQIILPAGLTHLRTYKITSGDIDYTPREISDPIKWDKLTSRSSSITSDFPAYFTIRNGILLNYPKIATAGLTITIEYLYLPPDMTADDYTTGTITAITSGDTTVTGDSTVWTSAMAGRHIKMPDGYWYEIDSVTSNTELELVKPYQGSTIAAGSSTYTIGELPIIPEDFQDLLWYRPVAVYHQMKGNEQIANYYSSNERRSPGVYESGLRDLRRRYSTQTTQNVYPDQEQIDVYNINEYPINIG